MLDNIQFFAGCILIVTVSGWFVLSLVRMIRLGSGVAAPVVSDTSSKNPSARVATRMIKTSNRILYIFLGVIMWLLWMLVGLTVIGGELDVAAVTIVCIAVIYWVSRINRYAGENRQK